VLLPAIKFCLIALLQLEECKSTLKLNLVAAACYPGRAARGPVYDRKKEKRKEEHQCEGRKKEGEKKSTSAREERKKEGKKEK